MLSLHVVARARGDTALSFKASSLYSLGLLSPLSAADAPALAPLDGRSFGRRLADVDRIGTLALPNASAAPDAG